MSVGDWMLIFDAAFLITVLVVTAVGIHRINWDHAHAMYVLDMDLEAYRVLNTTQRPLRIREWLNWDFTRYMK